MSRYGILIRAGMSAGFFLAAGATLSACGSANREPPQPSAGTIALSPQQACPRGGVPTAVHEDKDKITIDCSRVYEVPICGGLLGDRHVCYDTVPYGYYGYYSSPYVYQPPIVYRYQP